MRILVSSALSASTLAKVADGILANAALSGANTVMAGAELSVSTRPAFVTAVTRVDSTGLAEAAVATGAVDMPVKLPAPVVGTAEQAGPKSTAAAPDAGDDAAGEDAGADVAGEEDDDDPLELHAAALRASVTARPEVARRR